MIVKLHRCRRLAWILILYLYGVAFILPLVLTITTTLAEETQAPGASLLSQEPHISFLNKKIHDTEEIDKMIPREVVDAAKRLIRASLETNDFSSRMLQLVQESEDNFKRESDDENNFGRIILDDLTTILGLGFATHEIESMIQSVRNEWSSSTIPSQNECTRTSESKPPSVTTTTRIQSDDTCTISPSSQLNDDSESRMLGDRHATALLDAVRDKDCLEREFDVQNKDTFDVGEAIEVFQKCRILVLRNVFSKETTERVFPHYIKYISDVESGKISSEGTTSFGGEYFILREDDSRFNYLATKKLVEVSTGLFDNEVVLEILSDPSMLGESMIVNHVGTIDAQPGGDAQYWHTDGSYIPSDDVISSGFLGVGGHDLPPFAINMFTPLLPREGMGLEHGPTEFCLGTSHLEGHDVDKDLPLNDPSLLKADNGIIEDLQEFLWYVDRGQEPPPDADCPSHLHRVPLLKEGDAVLFDYMLTHRGGANRSKETNRSMIFANYSKKWFRDNNFDYFNEFEPMTTLEELTKLTRFALLEENGE